MVRTAIIESTLFVETTITRLLMRDKQSSRDISKELWQIKFEIIQQTSAWRYSNSNKRIKADGRSAVMKHSWHLDS